ncbi:MAG: carbohydrate ABC transporter permease [Cellulosilyticum sp.]|nr:carbohydrate ABC transporter permease [Cellulosilyticum sp.]
MKTKIVTSAKRDKLFDVVVLAFCIITFIIIVYPVYFILIASFSKASDVARGNVWIFPTSICLDGYREVFKSGEIWVGYRNTILYTIVGTILFLVINMPAAYALSRKDLKGKKIILFYFMFTMFFNGGMIPTYFTIKSFGLYNTFWVMVLPFSVNVYNIIVMKSFFDNSIPSSLYDAARIDGCSTTRYFISIVIPLSKAIIAVMTLWTAVSMWNSYFNALLYIKDDGLKPLQLILRNILVKNESMNFTGGTSQVAVRQLAEVMKYSVIVVSTVPIMCIYPFVQKYFNQGVMIGSVKE